MNLDLSMVKRLIARVVRWAVIESVGDDSGAYQVQQISYLERSGDSVAVYSYGFSALAPAETLAIMLAISGQSDARAHMPISGKERPRLKPGEVVVYNPKTGSKIHFKANADIDISSSEQINIDATRLDATIEGFHVLRGNLIMVPTSNVHIQGGVTIDDDLDHDGANVGFYGETPVTRPAISGTNDGNLQVLEDLCNRLHEMGLINDANYPR